MILIWSNHKNKTMKKTMENINYEIINFKYFNQTGEVFAMPTKRITATEARVN